MDKTDRINRAKQQKLFLISANCENEKYWKFEVEGTQSKNYKIIIHDKKLSCTCPDNKIRRKHCKHIFFIVIKIAGLEDPKDISYPEFTDKLKIVLSKRLGIVEENSNTQTDENCCICFESMFEHKVEKCSTCKNYFHDDCIEKWLNTTKNCPLCRSLWSKLAINKLNDGLCKFEGL